MFGNFDSVIHKVSDVNLVLCYYGYHFHPFHQNILQQFSPHY